MLVKIKKLDENAVTPSYGSNSAAGADLYNYKEDVEISPAKTVFVGTGICVEIPDGYVGLVFARSGLSCKQGVAPANKVGVIDSDYRGEIKVALYNHSCNTVVIKKGERIAQLVITPYLRADFCEAELSDTSRGAGGFGSTGK